MDTEKQKKKILNVYALLTVSLLMSFIPMMSFTFLALAMFLSVLIAAYILRRGNDKDTLIFDHMSYIIRTIWISSFFALISVGLASFYILGLYDPSPLLNCLSSIMDGTVVPESVNYQMIAPCMDDFVSLNKAILINGTIIAAAPIVVYLGCRLAKGISRVSKTHRIGDLKSWF